MAKKKKVEVLRVVLEDGKHIQLPGIEECIAFHRKINACDATKAINDPEIRMKYPEFGSARVVVFCDVSYKKRARK